MDEKSDMIILLIVYTLHAYQYWYLNIYSVCVFFYEINWVFIMRLYIISHSKGNRRKNIVSANIYSQHFAQTVSLVSGVEF